MLGLVARCDRPFTRIRPVFDDRGKPFQTPDWLCDRLQLSGRRMELFNRKMYGERRPDGFVLDVLRLDRRERPYVQESIRSGPNHLHVMVTRPDGSYENLGLSKNLLTNIGRDWWAGQWGFIPTAQNNPATATGATSFTGTGTTWTASNLATPQLGLAGMRVVFPITNVTTVPVYGNIVSNTTSVGTVDQWWTPADGVGTTPSSTANFAIEPGMMAALRFFAFSTDSGAASASHTTLTSEVTTNSLGRALGTYAHTFGQSTLTLSKTFTATGTITGAHKMGAFVCLTSAGADPMIYETVMNADFTVASGDQVTPTWTFTLSG